ncbi:hypothetical protein ABZW18_21120 [Streptomyces sp. NPDC004647]|uniref:hypothetical protein n=1 Tax=Streptomyces sp. NPDC004647 TaxID=3154671 RepID=UPI0033AEB122
MAIAAYFEHARAARSRLLAPPAFSDGDTLVCATNIVWERYAGRWTVPGEPEGITADDDVMRAWWASDNIRRYGRPTYITAPVLHRLTPGNLHRIDAPLYIDTCDGAPVNRERLRQIVSHLYGARTISAFWAEPTGAVIVRSSLLGDALFTPAAE